MSSVHARRAGLFFVVFTVFLDSIAQSISFPILPRLTEHLLRGDIAAAARWVGYLEVGWALPQLFAAPVLGMLSDRFGRRPVIVISVLVVGVELVVGALATDVWQLLGARILCGVACGGQAAAMAYVADLAEPEQRARAFGWVTGALWCGVALGPALTGVLAEVSLTAPFWAAAGFALAGALWGWLVLPESLPADARAPLRWASPWGAVGMLGRPELRALAGALFASWLAFQAKDNLLVLYTDHRYGWSPLQFGVFASALAVGTITVHGLAVGPLVARFGERAVAAGGMLLEAAGFFALGAAPSGAWFWAGHVPILLGVVSGPALQALLSGRVGEDEQGRLQGATGSVISSTSLVAPLVFTQLFAWGIGAGWAGVTVWIGGALMLLAAGLVVLSRGETPRS
jgi:DHA1 family tetracycline resistance protein-like MFS transporter